MKVQIGALELFETGRAWNLNGELINDKGEVIGDTPENVEVDDDGSFVKWLEEI